MNSRATPPSVFCPDLTFVPQAPHEAKRPVPLNRPVNVISTPVPGSVTADGAPAMSRVVVLNIDGQLYIRDLYGRANLHWNGQAATEARLRDGDRVRLGKIEYAVVAAGCPGPTTPPAATAAPAVEIVAAGAAPVRVRTPVTVVAPMETADLRLPANGDGAAAAACAMILRLGDLYWLWNLEPTTELRVNGQVVTRAELTDGSQVSVGGSEFRVRAVPVAAPPKSQAAPPPQRVAPPVKQAAVKPVTATKPKPPAATPFAATAAVLTPDAQPSDAQPPAANPSAKPPAVPVKASAAAAPANAPKAKPVAAPAGKPRVSPVVDEDDAEAIKRWGPLAFAVAAADRPELQQNGQAPAEPPPEFDEYADEPSHKGRRIALMVIMVVIVAALAAGAYYAWRYIS